MLATQLNDMVSDDAVKQHVILADGDDMIAAAEAWASTQGSSVEVLAGSWGAVFPRLGEVTHSRLHRARHRSPLWTCVTQFR